MAIDGIDAVASVLAAVTGGRRSGLVGVGLGALAFASLGVMALQSSPAADGRIQPLCL